MQTSAHTVVVGITWPGRGAFRWLHACCVAFAVLLAVVAHAEPTIEFDVQPRLLQVGESATASLRIRGVDNVGSPSFPDIDGFSVGGASTEQNISFVNGAQDRAITHKFSLTALKAGTYNIGPFSFQLAGKNFDLPAITIEVTEPKAAGSSGHPPLFARLEPSTTNLYVQQVFDLVLKLYVSQKVSLAGINALQNLPSQGLVVHQPRELDAQRELVDGEIYTVRRFVAQAQAITAGTFDLTPSLRVEIVNQQRKRRGGPFDDDFFGGFFNAVQTEPREIAIEPSKLLIQNLPEKGKPAGFAGAVGVYSFDMTCKPTDLAAGDPITMNFRIAGRGNIDSAQLPPLSLGEKFKVYEPKLINQNISRETSSGEKVFELVVMPRTPEANSIPEIGFSFFNPDKGVYETISRGPVALNVKPADKDKTSLIVESHGQPDASGGKAQVLGSDIVYLKPVPAVLHPRPPHVWFASPAVVSAQAVPAAALAGVYLLTRRRAKLAGDVSRARRSMAPKAARAGLEAARAATEARAFHDALWSAMATYFGHRLNLEPGEVSGDRVLGAFTTAGMKPEHADGLRDLFARCEQARFGGSAAIGDQERRELTDRLEKILTACEALRT